MFNLDLKNIPKEKIVLMGDKLIDYIEEIASITGKTIIGHGRLSDINILEKDCNCINNLFEKVGLEKPWNESRETLLQDLQNWYFEVLNRDEYGGFLDKKGKDK
ncbi:MAG: hypothetical protein K6G88_10795 [Lachnospiraceae bacterium]|nr:hypothetical protein [Lachnospiraceae bacterium]